MSVKRPLPPGQPEEASKEARSDVDQRQSRLAADIVDAHNVLRSAPHGEASARVTEELTAIKAHNDTPVDVRQLIAQILDDTPVTVASVTALGGESGTVPYSTWDKFWFTGYTTSSLTSWRSAYRPCLNINDSVFPLPERCFVVVIGDAGTGDKRQLEVFNRIGEVLREKHKATRENAVIIHLGDIYYYGSPEECKAFKDQIDASSAKDFQMYHLPGNHEYKRMGQGFFDVLLAPEGHKGQTRSFFCLKNEHIILAGLDTATESRSFPIHVPFTEEPDRTGAIETTQALWFQAHVAVDAADKRKPLILFSHHQYVSPYWKGAHENAYMKNIVSQDNIVDRVATWYWGHDHRLLVHNETGTRLKRGVCVGHGSMPENSYPAVKNKVVKYDVDYLPQIDTERHQFYNNGFIILEINRAEVTEHIYEVGWTTHKLIDRGFKPTKLV